MKTEKMTRRSTANKIAAVTLASLVGVSGCSKLQLGVAMLTGDSPKPLSSFVLDENRKEDLDLLELYARKKKSYVHISGTDTVRVFEHDVQRIEQSLLPEQRNYHFFLDLVQSQYFRRQKWYDRAIFQLSEAQRELETLSAHSALSLDQLAQLKEPFELRGALWLYHHESALLTLDRLKDGHLEVDVIYHIEKAFTSFDECLKLEPSGLAALLIRGRNRPELERIAQNYYQKLDEPITSQR